MDDVIDEARRLREILKVDHGVEIKLSRCRDAIARGFGCKDRRELEKVVERGDLLAWNGRAAAGHLGIAMPIALDVVDTLEMERELDAPPRRVKPLTIMTVLLASMARAEKVAVELGKALKMPDDVARDVTAVIYGHASWRDLVESTAGVVIADLPDEQCDAQTVNARFEYQVAALCEVTGLDEYVSQNVVTLLRPTYGAPEPCLDRLQEELDSKLFALGRGDLEDGMRLLMGNILGETVDDPMAFLDQMRTSHPINPDIWLQVLPQLGWTVADGDAEADKHGAQIGVAVSGDGRRYPIFLGAIVVNPSDHGDEQAEQLVRDVRRHHPYAVILFNRPTVFTEDGWPKTLIFGGFVVENGTAHKFCLSGEGGIGAALGQIGKFEETPSRQYADMYGVEGGLSLAAQVELVIAGGDPMKPYKIMTLSLKGGWRSVMPDQSDADR